MELSEDQIKFLDYYKRLPKNAGAIPHRDSVRIQDIPQFLGKLTVLHMEGPRRAFITLSGSKIEERLNTPLTGVNIYDLIPEREHALNEYLLRHVISQPCAGFSSLLGEIEGSGVTETSSLAVPFLDKDGKPTSVLLFQETDYTEVNPSLQINKSFEAIHISSMRNARFYDLGYGIPEDDGTISAYYASLGSAFISQN